MLVSIYNVEQYLPQCLDSLCAQTLKSLEIICINDGSTDASRAILDEYSKNNPNIVAINKENSGYGDIMNRGIKEAAGKYIGIVKSDDSIDSDAFEKLYNLANKYQADIVKTDYYYSEKGDEIHRAVRKQEANRVMSISDDCRILLKKPGIWFGICRRSFL